MRSRSSHLKVPHAPQPATAASPRASADEHARNRCKIVVNSLVEHKDAPDTAWVSDTGEPGRGARLGRAGAHEIESSGTPHLIRLGLLITLYVALLPTPSFLTLPQPNAGRNIGQP